MEECCAPQWVDFNETCSPQVTMQDYFDKEHMIHGRIVEFPSNSAQSELTSEGVQSKPILEITQPEPTSQNIHPELISESAQATPAFDNPSYINPQAQHDLEIIKSTPVKVISPGHRNKQAVREEITYDEVLSDAMRKLELCKKPIKTRDALNKTAQGLFTNIFKTPNMPVIKSSKSSGFRNIPRKQIEPDSAPNLVKSSKSICTPQRSNDTSVSVKESSISCSLFKQDEDKEPRDPTDDKNHKEDDKKMKYNKLNISTNDDKDWEEDTQDVLDATTEKHNKTTQYKRGGRTTLSICHNRIRSFNKRRTSNNFVSLAESVSKFQNETPKRFRTKSNKETTLTLSKLTQMRFKPTVPISPALMSKNRMRAVTVLSQEEREKQEMEEMKKYKIKANPVPRNVLKGPRTLKTMNKAKAVPESATSVTSVQPKSSLYHQKASSSKNTVTKVLMNDPTGIIVEREEVTFFGVPKDAAVKSVTRVVPFSFEARNKDLQMKKEQRLKNLQETNKTKAEFHARPVPNFSKQLTSMKQQNTKKSIVQPCPFSFEKRDKDLPKKKEELVKQVLQEDKKSRIFRANPVPVFKPVMVRGTSKEHLLPKEKTAKLGNDNVNKCDNQENKEPNVIAPKIKMEIKYLRKVKSSVCTVGRQNVPLKVKPEVKTESNDVVLELNTDKRAKERREFDERMKRKEIEEEMKRQEDNKKRLEHEQLMKAELRKLTEVKAKPMPTYKPLAIVKANKPLTNPQSPAFASKLRSKQD